MNAQVILTRQGEDAKQASCASMSSAVLACEDAPNPSHPNTSGATKQSRGFGWRGILTGLILTACVYGALWVLP